MPKKSKSKHESDSDLSDDDEQDQKASTLMDKVSKEEKQRKPHEKEAPPEPTTDETEDEPPFVVVIQGPKKSGKTTLIQSLVKHYTRHKLSSVHGTITLRSGRNRRITLIECPNEISGMIDMAKIADLCLILVDASVGFEMQTFEFLSILKSHGFPNVMGVLTHLDFFKENKQKRNTRKAMKTRFAQEVGENFKLFHLQGLKYDLYHKADVLNLARFISIIKFKQPEWKAMHPHVIIDRYENLIEGKPKDEDNCKIAFFGYIRGCSYRYTDQVHITGLGDFQISKMTVIEDPCPPAKKDNTLGMSKEEAGVEEGEGDEDDENAVGEAPRRKSKKKRTLKQNEKIIYAPQSNLGFLNYDQSSGYITIPDKHIVYTRVQEEEVDEFGRKIISAPQEEEDLGEGVEMVRKMQDMTKGIDEILAEEEEPDLLEGLQINVDTKKKKRPVRRDLLSDDEEEEKESNGKKSRTLDREDDDEENGEDYNGEEAGEDNDSQDEEFDRFEHKRKELREAKSRSLAAFDTLTKGQVKAIDDISKKIYDEVDSIVREETVAAYDCSRFRTTKLHDRSYYKLLVKSKFVTGGKFDDEEGGTEEEKDEDMNTSEEEDEDDEKSNADKETKANEQDEEAKKIEAEKKEKQDIRNKLKDELLELEYGVYKLGVYVRIEIEGIKYKHFRNFRPDFPMVLCRINPAEDSFGFLKVRVKKHRWYMNILKSNDPLIFSIGWRRFQSIPIYCREDPDERLRYSKYTPQHDFCVAIFYGNFAPQNAGVICTQTLDDRVAKFRIAATGYVMELNHGFEIFKKLKLIGEPFKVLKNTAFLKGMFTSKLEVSKFEGAELKTVSGIRGQIKKAVREGPDGSFRATFEDKILMSDIVFLRSWYKIEPEKFYNPVLSYQDVRLMKTTWELRKENKIEAPRKADSEYKQIERKKRVFNPLVIPKGLEANLPFASKQKLAPKKKADDLLSSLPIKSLKSDHEKQVYAMIQRLNTIKNEKKKLEKEKKTETKVKKQRILEGTHKDYMAKKKEERKNKFRRMEGQKKRLKKNEE